MQESPFILEVNLGVISRLERISVPNHQGENTRGLELVCKVPHGGARAFEKSNPTFMFLYVVTYS